MNHDMSTQKRASAIGPTSSTNPQTTDYGRWEIHDEMPQTAISFQAQGPRRLTALRRRTSSLKVFFRSVHPWVLAPFPIRQHSPDPSAKME